MNQFMTSALPTEEPIARPVPPQPGDRQHADWREKMRDARFGVGWVWRFLFNDGSASPQRKTGATDGLEPVSPLEKDWLRATLLPYRAAYRQAILLSIAINVIGLFVAVFSMQVYDRVVAHAGYTTLVALVLGMVVAIFMDHVFRSGRAVLLQKVGARIEVEVARSAYERLLHLPALVLENRPPGYWQAVFRDIEIVRATCSGATAMLLIDLPFLLLSLLVIGLMAWPLLPLALVTIVAFVVLAWRSGQVTRDANEREREQLVARDVVIAELSNARIGIKALAAHDAARQRWDQHYANWMSESLARSREADHYRELAHGMTTANSIITTSVGALAILSQMLTMGALIGTNILSGRMVSPLVQLVSQWRTFGQFKAARKRLSELFSLEMDRQDSAIELPRPHGVMTFEDPSFRYPGSEALQVHPFSGQIGPNGLHAIVGTNGSGKTTLLKLMRGLYRPEKGRILLDGQDMAQFTQNELAQWVGYLPQQVQLMSVSVRDNIAMGHMQASDEQILKAARLANAHDMVVNLPDGYSTQVGEGGQRFSAGQRKRIAIAQVLLMEPAILLLDEPTSDLDRVAEMEFIQILRELAKDRAVVVVTHSPSLLLHCNGILMMDKGKMVAAGSSAQMLPKLGLNVPAAAA